MALLLDKDIFGISNGEQFVFGDKSKVNVRLSTVEQFKKFCEVYTLDVPDFPGEPWTSIAKNLGLKKTAWSKFIPKDIFEKLLVDYIKHFLKEIKTKNQDKLWYYANIVPLEQRVLDSFATVCYADGTEKEPYHYKRTAVGRLVSDNNINLFQMSSDRRSQTLETRYVNGKIVSYDFKALEPRVILAINNPDALIDCDDVYTKILKLSNIDVTRDIIKGTLLRILNGSTLAPLARDYDIEVEKLEVLKESIFEIFGYEKTVEKLKEQYERTGRIFTYFGRPLLVPELNEKLFFTYYMQGTSADVCLIGFDQINAAIQKYNLGTKIKPLAMIYDSFILDVNLDHQEIIDEHIPLSISIKLNQQVIKFPLAKSEY